MTKYLKIDVTTNEIYSRCEATSRQQACRKLGVDDGNMHLYEVIAVSRYERLYGSAAR